MNNKVIIALDIGSSSVRAIAVDLQGQIVARGSRPLETVRPQQGWAELDVRDMLRKQTEILQEITAQIKPQTVLSLAVASQRSTVIFWDKLTGESLAPALSWQDGRAPVTPAAKQLGQEEVHRLTGLYLTPYYSAAKIAWALEHIAAVGQAARENRLCVGPAASYLIWQLSGGKVFACDPTLAQRMLLFDIRQMDWSPELLQAFGINRQWLPEIKPTCADYGSWEFDGRKIPLRVCVGDQQAALYASHLTDGEACINYGSGAFFMRHTGRQCHFLPGMLTSLAACVGRETARAEYVLEGPLNACGTVFNWLGALGIEIAQEQLDMFCNQSEHPIWFLPALGGLGAPYWDFKLSPVMAGFSPRSTKADVIKGAVQALACLMADIVFYVQQNGIKSDCIKVSGGLAQSRALLQMQADILQIPLAYYAEKENTALGACLLAAVEGGCDTSSWNTFETVHGTSPRLAAADAAELYRNWQHFVKWCRSRS